MSLMLFFPSEEHEDIWKNHIKIYDKINENAFPKVLSVHKNNYKEFLKKVRNYHNEIDIEEDSVPLSQYLLLGPNKDKILGVINIRHKLNENLFKFGGNIGYSINPGERGKGYGTKMLSLALKECKNMNFEKVLVTCNKDNIASRKVIKKNGGILENEIELENGIIGQRYWIII